MKTMTLKLPEALYGDIAAVAEDRGMSRSALVRQALADFFRRERPAAKGSALAMLDDLVGSVDGPEDLSVNRGHLDDLGR